MPQFLIDTNPLPGDTVELMPHEARHLRDVLRFALNDNIQLFNGRGRGYRGVVSELSRKTVKVTVTEVWTEQKPLVRIDLAVGLLPKDAMIDVVQRVTEFGIARLLPVKSSRSIVRKEPNYKQWENAMITAGKQCGRLAFPDLSKAESLEALVGRFQAYDLVLLGHFDGEPLSQLLSKNNADSTKSVLMILGPEGGFNKEEIALMTDSGAVPVVFGSRVFRTEAAAAFSAAVISSHYGV